MGKIKTDECQYSDKRRQNDEPLQEAHPSRARIKHPGERWVSLENLNLMGDLKVTFHLWVQSSFDKCAFRRTPRGNELVRPSAFVAAASRGRLAVRLRRARGQKLPCFMRAVCQGVTESSVGLYTTQPPLNAMPRSNIMRLAVWLQPAEPLFQVMGQ